MESGYPFCARAGLFLLVLCGASSAWAVTPNPLQSAYWRFEDGPADTPVNSGVADPVKDSINANHLDAYTSNSAPWFHDDVPPTLPQGATSNNTSLDFIPMNDVYTLFADAQDGKGAGKFINNGVIEPGAGFTLEAAFKLTDNSTFRTIVGKEGRPADDGDAMTTDFIENLPTLALKVRGDTGVLQIEQFDGAGNLVQVSSGSPITLDQWYYTAVVNTGSQLSLFLDANDGNGYQLQGTVDVDGALYQGENPDDPSWGHSWTIGRGQFGGGAADWWQGRIDEVRLTNRALAPYEFLFSADSSEMLVGDYNDDGTVDAADYVVWRNNLGGSGLPNDPTPGIVDINDYLNWKSTFGMAGAPGLVVAAVPEPATLTLCGLGLAGLWSWRRRSDIR